MVIRFARCAARLALLGLWCSLVGLVATPALADNGPAASPEAHRAAVQSAQEAAQRAIQRGPADIALGVQAHLALPDGFGFIPHAEAVALMKSFGNTPGDDFLGLIVPVGQPDADWLITIAFSPSGYVKDDDAKHWDADKLLESLKEGTEAGNEERIAAGVRAIKVTRWIAPPAYAADQHRLVWSAEVVQKDGKDDDPGVNYNTYLLGREGYLSFDLVTSVAAVEHDKPAVLGILDAVHFDSGKGYGDFNASTDKVAAYGLAALVAGVAAKKLGLLALLGVTIVKYAKLLLIAAAGLITAVRKWFQKRRGTPEAAAPAPAPTESASLPAPPSGTTDEQRPPS